MARVCLLAAVLVLVRVVRGAPMVHSRIALAAAEWQDKMQCTNYKTM